MKRSYHTDIIMQYKLDILPKEIYKQIPSSTLYNWRNKDVSSLFGLDNIRETETTLKMMKDYLSVKHLLKAAKAIYYIHCTYVNLFESVKNKKQIFLQSKEIIIETIERIKDSIGMARALKAFNISHQQFYAWKRKINCKISPINFCRKKYHNQLTEKEVNTIKKYLTKPEYRHWNITPIYYEILRNKAAFFSRTSFYKYTNRLQLQRSKPQKKKYNIGLRADSAKKILHMDVTIYKPLDHTKIYLYFLVDNYSRYILNWKASHDYSAKITFQNISEAYSKYNLEKVKPEINLITDGGSENKGLVDEFINKQQTNIQKLIAQTDIVFSNSMVEAVNKRIKYDFLYHTKLWSIEHVIQFLNKAIEQYNNKPHSALHGLTPYEVFNGAIPDKNMFKPAIKQAAQKRKSINLKQECLNC